MIHFEAVCVLVRLYNRRRWTGATALSGRLPCAPGEHKTQAHAQRRDSSAKYYRGAGTRACRVETRLDALPRSILQTPTRMSAQQTMSLRHDCVAYFVTQKQQYAVAL
jgi:hypothetical protein